MTIRIKIYDGYGNDVTIRLTSPTENGEGTWMPESPGMIKFALNWQNNVYLVAPYDRHPTTNAALFQTRTGDGGLTSVVLLREVSNTGSGRKFVRKQGDGEIENGELTMKLGPLGWTKL